MARSKSKKNTMSPAMAAYWAGSITASVAEDYAAGRAKCAFDFFFRAESNRHDPRSVPARSIRLWLPERTELAEALEAARAAGMPKGTHRTGCFEVQGPRGIWSHEAGNRIDLSTPRKAAKVSFKTWDELDAE